MDFSILINQLNVEYDLLDNLIHNIQLHAFTQNYAICCFYIKKISQ